MENNLLKTIFTNTFDKADLLKRISLIKQYLELQFYSDSELTLSKFLQQRQVNDDDKKALLEYPENFYKTFTVNTLYKLLNRINQEIKKISHIILFIPIEPNEVENKKISSWFRTEIPKHFFIDVRQNTELIAGCAFSKDGLTHDFSLHYLIRSKKYEILNILDNYDSKR